MRLLIVFGTRPEAIKLAPLINALRDDPYFDIRICVTAQHRDMLDQVLKLFSIQPDYDLNIMTKSQNLTTITCHTLTGLEPVIREVKPDYMVVHGDTTTTLASALAASYQQIPVAHVEAGLRTGNMYAPWPEEINRKLTAGLTHLHFSPTELAKQCLLKENISSDSICVTGNTVIDALLQVIETIKTDTVLQAKLAQQFRFLKPERRVVLITGHRRENIGEGFEHVCHALSSAAERFADIDFVYPIHMNPKVRQHFTNQFDAYPNFHFIEPIDYLAFVYLMQRSDIILTDSGGIQEEAPSLGKPVLVMRNHTERPEAITAGTVKLVGTDSAVILDALESLLTNRENYERMAFAHNPYGDGKACQRIVAALKEHKNTRHLSKSNPTIAPLAQDNAASQPSTITTKIATNAL